MEKVLITSTRAEKMKRFMMRSSMITLVCAALIALFMLLPIYDHSYYHYSIFGESEYVENYINSYIALSDAEALAIVLLCVGGVCFLYAATTLLIYWGMSKCELTITESSVRGKAMFGKEVTLPISMIAAYGTIKWISAIAITTASGAVKFAMIENYAAIGKTLSDLIRQERMATVTPMVAVSQQPVVQVVSNDGPANDLVKLKSYLDQGIITQEEFDAKKKQILGL